MKLIDFSSWLEIFIVINLAYAGSKDFRNYLTAVISKGRDIVSLLYSVYTDLYKYLTKKLSVTLGKAPHELKYRQTLERYKQDFEKQDKIVIYQSIIERDFTNRFKSLFFIGALSGLVQLLACGMQEAINEHAMLKIIYTVNFTVCFYALFVFVFSLFFNKIDRPINIFINLLLIIMLVILALLLLEKVYEMDSLIKFKDLFVIGAVISVVLPTFLFFLRFTLQLLFTILYLVWILLVGLVQLVLVYALIQIHGWSDKKL